jgi:hypothetical protein
MRKLTVIRFKPAVEGQQGELIKKSTTKPEWGSMLVMETILTINNGIINPRKRVAAIRAKLVELDALNLKEGDDFNKKLAELGGKEHRIVYTEATAPQYEGQKAKVNPKTSEVIKDIHGAPIYLSASVQLASVEDDMIPTGVAVSQESGAANLA